MRLEKSVLVLVVVDLLLVSKMKPRQDLPCSDLVTLDRPLLLPSDLKPIPEDQTHPSLQVPASMTPTDQRHPSAQVQPSAQALNLSRLALQSTVFETSRLWQGLLPSLLDSVVLVVHQP